MYREPARLPRQPPGGGGLEVVTVVVGVEVTLGVVVTVTVLVLVLVVGGGASVVVVTVVTVVVAVADDVVAAGAAAITPQATRLPESPVLVKLPGSWWMTSALPKLFLRSAAVNAVVVVTSFAAPSGRTCSEVRSPLAG